MYQQEQVTALLELHFDVYIVKIKEVERWIKFHRFQGTDKPFMDIWRILWIQKSECYDL